MENINNTKKLLNIIDNKIDELKSNLEAYRAVNATLSTNTLFNVAVYLEMTNNILEKGFIKDACNEIEEAYKLN